MTKDDFRIREVNQINHLHQPVSTHYVVDVRIRWSFLWWGGERWDVVQRDVFCGGYCGPGRADIEFATRDDAEGYIHRRLTQQ